MTVSNNERPRFPFLENSNGCKGFQKRDKTQKKQFKNNARTQKVQKYKCIMNKTPEEVRAFSLSSLLHNKTQSSIFGGPKQKHLVQISQILILKEA